MSAVEQYAAPKSNLDTGSEEFGEVKVFSTRGRLGRLRYLAYSFGLSLLAMIVVGAISGIAAAAGVAGGIVSGVLMVAMYGFMIVISVILTVRRCHDFNTSGWLSLLLLLPLVPIIFWFIPGTDGPNKFGAKPPPNSVLVTIGGLLIPIVFVGGILAAIAIPAYQGYVQQAQQASQNR